MFVQEITGRVADRDGSQAGVAAWARLHCTGRLGSRLGGGRLGRRRGVCCRAGTFGTWDEGWECGEGLRGCRDRKRPGQASRKLQGAWVDSTPAPLKWKGRTWSNRGTGTSPCGREISTFDIRYARLMWFDIKFVRLSKYDTADVNSF